MVTLEEMLACSVHLGHKVQQWNPKMNLYIYGERNGIHIIDLLQTLICLKKTRAFLTSAIKQKKTILIVSTKRQFANVIEECAKVTSSHYITQRWLGGMLTNWNTIKLCIDNLQLLYE